MSLENAQSSDGRIRQVGLIAEVVLQAQITTGTIWITCYTP
jgi:hypothetical protein